MSWYANGFFIVCYSLKLLPFTCDSLFLILRIFLFFFAVHRISCSHLLPSAKCMCGDFIFHLFFKHFSCVFFLLLLLLHSAWHFDFYLNKHGASFCEARFNKAKIKNENKFVGSVNLYRYAEGAATISPHRMKFILLLLFYVLHVDVPTNSICIPHLWCKKKTKIHSDRWQIYHSICHCFCLRHFISNNNLTHKYIWKFETEKREKKQHIPIILNLKCYC